MYAGTYTSAKEAIAHAAVEVSCRCTCLLQAGQPALGMRKTAAAALRQPYKIPELRIMLSRSSSWTAALCISLTNTRPHLILLLVLAGFLPLAHV